MNLKGKVAIVTGGNSGIGLAIVLELAKQGANIVIDYVAHPEATEALEKQVSALGDQAIGVQADVSKVADLQRLIATAVKGFGRVDVMVNNAGIETRTSVLDTTEAKLLRFLERNRHWFFDEDMLARLDRRSRNRPVLLHRGQNQDQIDVLGLDEFTVVRGEARDAQLVHH